MNPLSGYDIIYKGMSNEEHEKLQADIDNILVKSAVNAERVLTNAIQKAVTAMYEECTANPWIDVLKENGGSYEFASALATRLWESMLKMSPMEFVKVNEWRSKDLLKHWAKNFPEEIKELAGGIIFDKDFINGTL